MIKISSVRLAVPKAAEGEIVREKLINCVLRSKSKIAYIHAGAGYGKTTLLSQLANSMEGSVWLTLDGESDIFIFLNILSEALRHTFPDYDFSASEYLPFEGKSNFITILANVFISSIENLSKDFIIILDDLHTIEEPKIRSLIACILKYKPENIRFYLSSREAPWQELIPLKVKGSILELTQKDLTFTRDETIQILGLDDSNIYSLTEGWPLAIGSFKVLLENGVSPADIPSRGNEALYSYLFYECLSRLSSEMVDFLKTSSCFDELDPQMLDTVLNIKNSVNLLENLSSRNIFTIKTGIRQYRYHALFREYLQESAAASEKLSLQHKAILYYYNKKEYSKAAKYAIVSDDMEMLKQIILKSYKDYIKSGSFSELRLWFQALGDSTSMLSREILVAKGAFLSSIGNFTDAKACLDAAIPLLREKEDDKELYIEAMVHKARVLRNFVSFEESNILLDELITKLDNLASEITFTVVIEKLYNLCWNSQINNAYAVAYNMIEACAKAGNVKVKAWYERYLSAIHFFAGRMKDSVYYYEKSLELPESERQYLDMHSIDIYVAKAYQMLGDRERSISIISAELQKLRSMGRYEEMWSGYLFAAEIFYQNTFIDRMNGSGQTFESTMKYFSLAEEYAPLYRKTDMQIQWAKLQRLSYSLMFTDESKENITNEIFTNLENAGDYLKTIILGRLFGYFAAVSDFPNAVKCARLCIEIGEKSNIMLLPTLAYGILARAAITMKNHGQGVYLTKRYLQLCSENGIYEYFRMRKAYDPILEFAYDNGIEPDITKQLMEFAGYQIKKAYVKALGTFSIYSDKNGNSPLKMRTKKERELLAFLLASGSEGATKEQICEALWAESESDNVKKLIGVNLAQIKKDLALLGIENPIINIEKHYKICRDEIEYDIDLLEEAISEFNINKNAEAAHKIQALYKGEYLADFEALWATAKKIEYAEAYEKAFEYSK